MSFIDELPGGRKKPKPTDVPIDPGLRPPESQPDPPLIPPGINPGDEIDDPSYSPPETDDPTEPQPQIGLLLSDDLMTKSGTYGGVGANCRSRSTNWNEMASMPYWLSGSISGRMNGSTLSLESNLDAWMGTDSLMGVIAENSYVEMDISLTASGGSWGDFVEPFSVCLEGDDSISLSVGSSIYDFSIVKNGTEIISSDFVAELNTVFSSFSVTLTITKAVHCSYEVEQDPDDWYEPHPGMPEPAPEEAPIDDEDGSDGGEGAQGDFEWTQADSWVLLGLIVLILLSLYVRNTVRGAEDG